MSAYLATLTLTLADAVANGISTAQTKTAGNSLTITGSLASGGVATMDVARRVIVTSTDDETGNTFKITGTDRYGRALTETIAGKSSAAASTINDFKTVTSIIPSATITANVTAGTNQVASTAPLVVDTYSNHPYIGLTLTPTGTFTASIEVANDDLGPNYDMVANPPTWTAPSAFSSKNATTQGQIAGPITLLRLTSVSYTNPATMTAKVNLPFGVGSF